MKKCNLGQYIKIFFNNLVEAGRHRKSDAIYKSLNTMLAATSKGDVKALEDFFGDDMDLSQSIPALIALITAAENNQEACAIFLMDRKVSPLAVSIGERPNLHIVSLEPAFTLARKNGHEALASLMEQRGKGNGPTPPPSAPSA